MVENSKIEWTDHTFSPWVGCTKVSAACDNCYAELWSRRTGQAQLWQGERRRTTKDYWRMPHRWNAKAAAEGVRRKVFCASLADVFDNQANPDWRRDLWRLIEATPHLDWLILTKRPQNMRKMIIAARRTNLGANVGDEHLIWPWPNVWLGTTVENQEEADWRIPHLLAVPAKVHFLSMEPLLGPVRLAKYIGYIGRAFDAREPELIVPHPKISWTIVGGESGPKRRPMDLAWARDLRDQCVATGTPYFFKQVDKKQAIPDDLMIRQFPTPTSTSGPSTHSAV